MDEPHHTGRADESRKDAIKERGLVALRFIHSDQTWERWMDIGEAMLVITEEAQAVVGAKSWDKDNKPLVKVFNRRWEDYEQRATNKPGHKPLSKQERTMLRFVMAHPEIAAWRAIQVGPRKRKLNHPNAVVNAWKRTQPRAAAEAKAAEGAKPAAKAARLDQGKAQKEAATTTDLKSVQPEGRREVFAELLDAAAAKHFSDKGALRIEDAIRVHKARLNKAFEWQVNQEVRRRIDAANNATRAQNKELRLENFNLQRMIGQRGVFTETQYKQMLMLCHPDDSASPELRARLLQILVENKIRLVKPVDMAKPRRKG
jgi:hypothetical protein